MKTSWTCRALGLCLSAMVPALGFGQDSIYSAPQADYSYGAQNYQYNYEQPQPLYAAPEAPQALPAVDTVSAASYYNLLERVEKLEAEAAEEACKEVDILTKPTQKWTGRIHADYWHFPEDSDLPNFIETDNVNQSPEDFLGFRRIRLGIQGNLSETMIYKSEFDFAQPNNMVIKDVYFGWDDLPFLHTVLIGNQKRPYGLDHLNSSRYNVFMERPFVVEAINQDARRVGAASYGLSDNEAWNWRYGTYIMNDLQGDGGQYTDNYQSEFAGRLANTIWYDETSGGRGYAHWAVSGTAAFPSGGGADRFRTRPEARTDERWIDTGVLGAANYQMIGLESVVNVGAFSFVGEYMAVHADRTANPDVNFHGGYFYLAYWLTGEYSPWSRESGTLDRPKPIENFWFVNRCDGCRSYGWGAWQVAARYSYCDFTDEDVFGGVGESVTLGLNWWWNPNAHWQLNYIQGRLSDRVVAGAGTDAGWYQMIGCRFSVDF